MERGARRLEIFQDDFDNRSVRMAVAATSKIDLKKYEKEADATMCRLWDEVMEDGRIEGRAEGMVQGLAKGKAEDIVDVLEDMGQVPEELREFIYKQNDLEELKRLLKLAVRAGSVEEFERKAGILVTG